MIEIKHRTDHPRASEWRKMGWTWVVKAFYGNKADKGKLLAKVAFEIRHKDPWSVKMEVEATKRRDDIGLIEVYTL